MKKVFKIFKSHEEQETAEINYWKRISRGKRVETLEKMRLNYLKMRYGRIPRLRRVFKIVRKAQS